MLGRDGSGTQCSNKRGSRVSACILSGDQGEAKDRRLERAWYSIRYDGTAFPSNFVIDVDQVVRIVNNNNDTTFLKSFGSQS